LLVFIHGGYWRAFDKHDFSWLAEPYVRAGASVALLNYGLSPATPIETAVAQVRRACAWLRDNASRFAFDPRRMVCSGHSAGAHLTAMVVSGGEPALDQALLCGVVIMSVLADLEPLVGMPFVNVDLQLDVERARALSPIRCRPAMQVPVHAVVGELETAEFKRQTQLLCDAWGAQVPCTASTAPAVHHMSICDAFADPDSALFEATCRLLGIQRG
jgi:arylformamidase